jgi:hypothetical protein
MSSEHKCEKPASITALEIGSRRLLRTVAGMTNEVIVRVRQPVEVSEGAFKDNYACRFEIEGLPEGVSQDAIGVDSLQALLCALGGLYHALRPFQRELTQYGDEPDGEIHLPFMTYGFDLDGQRRLEKAVEREMRAIMDEKLATKREKRNAQASGNNS